METPTYITTTLSQKVQENNSNSDSHISPRAGAVIRRLSQETGESAVIEMLASYGADISSRDDQGLTPLHLAIRKGNDDTVEVLINAGAYINAKNMQGDTPLHLAASEGLLGIVQKLLKAGANIETKNSDGLMPIDLVKSGCTHDEITKLLINYQDTRCREFLEVEVKDLLGSDVDPIPEI